MVCRRPLKEEFFLSLGGRGDPGPDGTDIMLNTNFASEWHLYFQTYSLAFPCIMTFDVNGIYTNMFKVSTWLHEFPSKSSMNYYSFLFLGNDVIYGSI